MRQFIAIALFFGLVGPVWAEDRYVSEGKVIYAAPREADVLRINVSMGFCTVLEFPEKPVMVTVGDNALLQIEVPKNSRNVVLKPLDTVGITNLFVFTQTKRFNYEVIVKDDGQADYVVDTKGSGKEAKRKKVVSTGMLITMAKNYDVLKTLKTYDPHQFVQKDLFYSLKSEGLDVKVIEAFTYQDPHNLVLHVVVQNTGKQKIELNEKKTNIYINDRKFQPRYVLFDAPVLNPSEKTDAWLILEGTHISMENHFTFGIGVGEKEYVCH